MPRHLQDANSQVQQAGTAGGTWAARCRAAALSQRDFCSSISCAMDGRGPEAAYLVLKRSIFFNMKIRAKESERSILRLAEAGKQASPVRALLRCGTSGQAAILFTSCGKPARLHDEAREGDAIQAVDLSNVFFCMVVVMILPYS